MKRVVFFSFSIFIMLTFTLVISYSACSFLFIEDDYRHPLNKYSWLLFIYFTYMFFFDIIKDEVDKSIRVINLLKANILAFITTVLVLFFTKEMDNYSRSIQLSFFILNNLIPISLNFSGSILSKLKLLQYEITVICSEKSRKTVYKWLKEESLLSFKVVEEILIESKADIISLGNRSFYSDIVIFSFNKRKPLTILTIIDLLQNNCRKLIFIPEEPNPIFGSIKTIYTLSRRNFAFISENRLLDRKSTVFKRMFDLIVSTVGIIIFLPLMVLIFFIILIVEKEFPIFKQKRIGINGKEFTIYKFKTMRKDASKILEEILEKNHKLREEWEREHKLREDPRITRIGKFLRKTSLDELPQLFNVFKGDMSIVGPRPIVKEEIKKYEENFTFYTSVKPGITGLWQISGRSNLTYKERVDLDLWYVRNWSIWLDIFIIIKTLFVFFNVRDSY